MVKKGMILKVHMRCDKCRTKALKLAAEACGVTAVKLEGEYPEKLVVEGYGVKIDKLVHTLEKKVGYTEILFVYNVNVNV